MAWLSLVTIGALLVYMWCSLRVGIARSKYGIEAPATTGNELFERHYRVQQNSVEQLVVFLPALWVFGTFWSAPLAAGIGSIFVVGRIVYALGYVADPKRRTVGFLMGYLANAVLVVGGLVGTVMALA
jgi:glutathione S-transferase